MPDQFWDTTANAVKLPDLIKDYGALATVKTELDARMKAVPEKPDGYKLELPAEFKLPDGVTWTWDEKNPLIAQAREFAKASGLNQQQFSQIASMFVGSKVAEKLALDKSMADLVAAETGKLGANGPARVDAAKLALTAAVGKERADEFFSRPVYASDLKIIEDLLKTAGAQGGGDLNGKGREAPKSPPVTVEQRWYQQKAN